MWKGSTSCRRLVLLLRIVAEIASQNIIEAWKRKFQVLPAYIIANSGERTVGAEQKAVRSCAQCTLTSRYMQHFATTRQAIGTTAESRECNTHNFPFVFKNKLITYSKRLSSFRYFFPWFTSVPLRQSQHRFWPYISHHVQLVIHFSFHHVTSQGLSSCRLR